MRSIKLQETDARTPDATEADTSATTIDTVPDSKGTNEFPDFMLCHTHTVETEEPEDAERVYGWNRRMKRKVLHLCFPLILEVKACPDRTMQGENLQARASSALGEAEEELYEYVQTCFTRDASADSVIAMSAAGPYWRWITVRREEVCPDIFTLLSKERYAFVQRFKKAKIFTLGTKKSDDELTKLRDFGLIPILETHHWYKSTLVSNAQQ